MKDFRPDRLKKIGVSALIVFVLGMLYYFFVRLTGLRIPCVLKMLTNKFCPGCGITRLFSAVIEGDFALAFRQNQAFFCLLPFFIIWGIYKAYRYVFNKKCSIALWENIVLTIIIIALLIFAVLRNLPGFEFLAPIPWEELK